MKRTFGRTGNKLPPVAFAIHPSTGATLMIRRGERRTYPTITRLTVDELNRVFSVSAAQADAMLAGSLYGWGCRGADPATYAVAASCVLMDHRRIQP